VRGASSRTIRGASTALRWRQGPGAGSGSIAGGGSASEVVDNRPLRKEHRPPVGPFGGGL